ncbi:MAG: porin family protein [Alistipes indistinctus]
MNFRKIGCAVIMLTLVLSAAAQSESGKKFEYRIKAGFNIGGTLPIPLPAEIRKIESYSPTMAFTVEGSVLRWFTPKWALTTGLRFETKGMNAGAKVKNYQMTLLIENGDKTGEMSGRFTGQIKTRVQNEYITLPILVVRELSPLGDQTRPLHRLPHRRQLYRVGFRRLHPRRRPDRHQSRRRIGDVRLRIRTAPFQLGGQFGAEWQAYRHLSVYADLTCAANSIFKKISTASASTCITCISRSVSATGSDFHDTDKNRSFASQAPVFHLANTDK